MTLLPLFDTLHLYKGYYCLKCQCYNNRKNGAERMRQERNDVYLPSDKELPRKSKGIAQHRFYRSPEETKICGIATLYQPPGDERSDFLNRSFPTVSQAEEHMSDEVFQLYTSPVSPWQTAGGTGRIQDGAIYENRKNSYKEARLHMSGNR